MKLVSVEAIAFWPVCSGPLKPSESEQVEASAAVHLALDGFESMNLSFYLALAPGQLEGRFDCILILG